MLFRKMLRDMGNHKMQFISIFIMAFLGVFIYAGVGGEWIGLRNNSDTYYRETNFADAWVYGKSFSAQDETAVKKLSGVTGAERCLVLDGAADLSGKPKLSLHFLEKDTITKSHLVRGEAFRNDADGIWVDDRFASAHRLKPGDKLTVTVNGLRLEKKIVGTVYNPEYVYLAAGSGITPDFSSYGYAYLSKDAFPVPEKLAYNEMMLTTADGTDVSGLGKPGGKSAERQRFRLPHPRKSAELQHVRAGDRPAQGDGFDLPGRVSCHCASHHPDDHDTHRQRPARPDRNAEGDGLFQPDDSASLCFLRLLAFACRFAPRCRSSGRLRSPSCFTLPCRVFTLCRNGDRRSTFPFT